MISANSGIEKDQEILDEHHARTDAHQRIYPSLDAMTGDPSRLPEEPGMQSCMNLVSVALCIVKQYYN
jgi:hypothetical protein